MIRGEEICKNCGEKPDEIIVETEEDEKMRTSYNTDDSHTITTEKEYETLLRKTEENKPNRRLVFKYFILPFIIFCSFTFIIYFIFNLCHSFPEGTDTQEFILTLSIAINIFLIGPFYIFLQILLIKEYYSKQNKN